MRPEANSMNGNRKNRFLTCRRLFISLIFVPWVWIWMSYNIIIITLTRGTGSVESKEQNVKHKKPFVDTESFSCNTTIPQLEALQRHLGLRTPQNVLLSREELIQKRQRFNGTETPEILLTDYGWMSSTKNSSSVPRTKWSTLLLAAIQSHEWYNPLGWYEQTSNRTRYVFLDVETSQEVNWPVYNRDNYEQCDGIRGSAVRKNNRRTCCIHPNLCELVTEVLGMPLFATSPNAKLVLFFVGAHLNGISFVKRFPCLGPDRPAGDRIVVVGVTLCPSQMLLGVDMGMPPPAPNAVNLMQDSIDAIGNCSADLDDDVRPYLLSFQGTQRRYAPVRKDLIQLGRNQRDMLLRGKGQKLPNNMTYRDLLSKSKFAAAPRGDQLFSYRFTEILSAGAIPVVYADGWALPFSRDLIHWEDYMVVMKENRVHRTRNFLERISPERRCQMRKKGWEVYNKYMRSRAGVLQGVIDTLETRRRKAPVKVSWQQVSPFPECWLGDGKSFKQDIAFAMKCYKKP